MQLSPDLECGNVFVGGALLLDHKTGSDLGPILKLVMILNNYSRALRSLHRRRILRVSALSALDCKLYAYNGCNG